MSAVFSEPLIEATFFVTPMPMYRGGAMPSNPPFEVIVHGTSPLDCERKAHEEVKVCFWGRYTMQRIWDSGK